MRLGLITTLDGETVCAKATRMDVGWKDIADFQTAEHKRHLREIIRAAENALARIEEPVAA